MLTAAAALAGALLASADAQSVGESAQPPPPTGQPIVVELFSSQGCSSCPRANRILTELSQDPNVLPLTFSVGYWDYLGWSDTFARPEFSSRQRAYLRRLGVRSPYTPQMVVQGMRQESGSHPQRVFTLLNEVRAALPSAAGRPRSIDVEADAEGDGVEVDIASARGGAPEAPADIWAVEFEPGAQWVQIQSGENAGHRMVHFNVVRRLQHIGVWTGRGQQVSVDECGPGCAILVQEAQGGAVLAAAALIP
jgi:hypothetical protein